MIPQALIDEVTRNRTVDGGARAAIVALRADLATEIEKNKDDPVALQAMADDLRSENDQTEALVNAVVANTSSASR